MATPRVKCPTCRKSGDWFAGPHGPFCSRRCKLIDLGKWFGEEHVIATPLSPEQAANIIPVTADENPSQSGELDL